MFVYQLAFPTRLWAPVRQESCHAFVHACVIHLFNKCLLTPIVCQALCSVNNTGVVLSLLAVPRGSLDTLRLFLRVSLGFASTQLISGMAVCWHDFFKLDLCPQLDCKLLRDIILNTLVNLLPPPPRGRTAWHKGPHHTRPWVDFILLQGVDFILCSWEPLKDF